MALMNVRRCLVTLDMNGTRLIAYASSESEEPEIFSIFDENCADEMVLAKKFDVWMWTLGGYEVWIRGDDRREVQFIDTHFKTNLVLGVYTLFRVLPFR